MSISTTSPGNEAGMTGVDVLVSNSTAPTVVTRDEIWMSSFPAPAASVNGTPTAVNGTTPTVSTEYIISAGNSLTPTVIENTNNVGPVAAGTGNDATSMSSDGTVVAQAVGTNPTAHCATGTPTVFCDQHIRMISGTSPTASRDAEGSDNVAWVRQAINDGNTTRDHNGMTPVIAEPVRCVHLNAEGVGTPTACASEDVGGTPTVITNTSNVGPMADLVSGSNTAPLRWLIVSTECTANVAESSAPVFARERLAA